MSKLKDVPYLAKSIIGCSEITVYRKVRAGVLPHIRIGKLIRFSESHIHQIESNLGNGIVEKTEDKNET